MNENPNTVLIFDDDPDILDLCRYILEKRGFIVQVRETCQDVIEVMEEVKPDLVLMDNWIPDMGGVKATQAIKSHPSFKHTPVIYFSANQDVRHLAELALADSYIAKPFNLAFFEKKIGDALAP